MEIRPFHCEDAEAVVELWRACQLTRAWNDPHKDIQRKLLVQPELFLVACDNARVVGSVMAGYDGHRGWINYLAVAPQRRREGIARRLMEQAERLLLQAGCPKINLQIRQANGEVQAFYRALGYTADEVVSMGKRLIPDEPPGDFNAG